MNKALTELNVPADIIAIIGSYNMRDENDIDGDYMDLWLYIHESAPKPPHMLEFNVVDLVREKKMRGWVRHAGLLFSLSEAITWAARMDAGPTREKYVKQRDAAAHQLILKGTRVSQLTQIEVLLEMEALAWLVSDDAL